MTTEVGGLVPEEAHAAEEASRTHRQRWGHRRGTFRADGVHTAAGAASPGPRPHPTHKTPRGQSKLGGRRGACNPERPHCPSPGSWAHRRACWGIWPLGEKSNDPRDPTFSRLASGETKRRQLIKSSASVAAQAAPWGRVGQGAGNAHDTEVTGGQGPCWANSAVPTRTSSSKRTFIISTPEVKSHFPRVG